MIQNSKLQAGTELQNSSQDTKIVKDRSVQQKMQQKSTGTSR